MRIPERKEDSSGDKLELGGPPWDFGVEGE